MDFERLINFLPQRLQQPLPREIAWQPMIPPSYDQNRYRQYDVSNARKAAVMALFYPDNDLAATNNGGRTAKLVYIKRTEDQYVHSGQIGFRVVVLSQPIPTCLQLPCAKHTKKLT